MGSQRYDQRYEAARKTLGELLSTASPPIKVPEWQRSYSWAPTQVAEFWGDLTAFSDRYPDANIDGREYFLGSVVLVTEPSRYLLLDGQQRLATATILLSVLRDIRLKYSADSAARLQQKYILDYDDANGVYQPSLTLNSYDEKFFADQIQSNEPPNEKPKLKSQGLIAKTKKYFTEKLVTEYAKFDDAAEAYRAVNLRFTKVLVDHMSVVAVTSSDEDNAAAVFETLNDRGIGLSTTDLLRSLLMRRAKDQDRGEINRCWLNILSMTEQVSVDQFLRHYWISINGDEKARSLYRVVKEYIEDNKIDSLQFTEELSRAADIYRDVCAFNSESAELRSLLRDIAALGPGARALYPALLSALGSCNADASGLPQIADFARTLVTLYVRYSVIAQRESTLLETTLFNVAKELRGTCDFSKANQALRERAPDLEEFAKQFSVCSISRTQTATYLLRKLEHYGQGTAEFEVAGTDKVHLEHIYPKQPASHWQPILNHNVWLNRLGNLTLLDKTKNTAIKNQPFDEKLKAYANSSIELTKQLTNYAAWTEQSIESRQREMALDAAYIWKFPNEDVPANLAEVIEDKTAESDAAEDLPEFPETSDS